MRNNRTRHFCENYKVTSHKKRFCGCVCGWVVDVVQNPCGGCTECRRILRVTESTVWMKQEVEDMHSTFWVILNCYRYVVIDHGVMMKIDSIDYDVFPMMQTHNDPVVPAVLRLRKTCTCGCRETQFTKKSFFCHCQPELCLDWIITGHFLSSPRDHQRRNTTDHGPLEDFGVWGSL